MKKELGIIFTLFTPFVFADDSYYLKVNNEGEVEVVFNYYTDENGNEVKIPSYQTTQEYLEENNIVPKKSKEEKHITKAIIDNNSNEKTERDKLEDYFYTNLDFSIDSNRIKLNKRGIKSNTKLINFSKLKDSENTKYCDEDYCFDESKYFWDITDDSYIYNSEFALSLKGMNLNKTIQENAETARVYVYEKINLNLYKKILYGEAVALYKDYRNFNFNTKDNRYIDSLIGYQSTDLIYKEFKQYDFKGVYEDIHGNKIDFTNNKMELFGCQINFNDEGKNYIKKSLNNFIPVTPQILSYENEEINECNKLIKNDGISKLLIYKKENTLNLLYETNKILYITNFKMEK